MTSKDCPPQFLELVRTISTKLSELTNGNVGGHENYGGEEPPSANYQCELDGVHYCVAIYGYVPKDIK